MEPLLHVGLNNALVAGLLVIPAAAATLARRPALAHGLWLLVLIKLITPPLVWVPLSAPSTPWNSNAPVPALRYVGPVVDPPGAVQRFDPARVIVLPELSDDASLPIDVPGVAPATHAAADVPAIWPSSGPWVAALPALWLSGSLVWFVIAGWRIARFQRLLRYAVVGPPRLQRRVAVLAGQLGVRAPAACLVPGRIAPMLWAMGRPRLVLPAWLLEQVTASQLDALLAHELAHLRRRDHWVRAVEFLVLGLYWWLPIAWLARRELREAEEQCCDAWVVAALPGAGRAYADALVDTLDFLADAPAAPMLASGIGQVSDLKRRLHMILKGTTTRAMTWRGVALMAGLALLLPLVPMWVNGEEEKRPPEGRKEPPKPEVVEKVRAEVQKLKSDLNRKAAELAEMAKKLHETHQKLGGREGRPGPGAEGRLGGEPRSFILHKEGDNWIIRPVPAPFFDRRGGPGRPDGEPGERPPFGRRPFEGRGKGRPGGEDGRPGGPPPDGERPPRREGGPGAPEGRGPRPGGGERVEQLERRLDRVLQELEELRRELGPRGGRGGERPPRGPGGERGPGGPRPEKDGQPKGPPPPRD